MRCAVVQELFSEIYDGMAEGQALLEKHLQNCPTCAAEYEGYKQMLDELRQIPMPELPVGFHESMMEKIREIAPPSDHAIDELLNGIETRNRRREATRKKRSGVVVRRWAGVAVAACLLLASVWGVRVLDLPANRTSDEAPVAMEMQYGAPETAYAIPQEAMEFWADDSDFYYSHDDIWAVPQYDISLPEISAEHEYQAPADMAADVLEESEYLINNIMAENYDDAIGGRGGPIGFAATSAEEDLFQNENAPPPPEGLRSGYVVENQRPWVIIIIAITIPICVAIGAGFWIINNKNLKKNK
ncbi:MAG: hypothetical protein FWE42_07305 [Defluviitaleaceae bacterium]|nr:hypothetical protein [Defluviitaleaceae bacterium]